MTWTNGRKNPGGAVFGFKIAAEDRDQRPPPFWSGYRELIDEDIEKWMLRCVHSPWSKGKPPTVDVERLEAGAFPIRGLAAVRGRQ